MAIDSSFKFIAYPLAMKRLAARWAATPEELAAWVWVGPKDSGLAAYRNANEIDPPSRFYYEFNGDSNADYLSPLMARCARRKCRSAGKSHACRGLPV